MSADTDREPPVCGVRLGDSSFTVTGLRYERRPAGEYWDDNWVVVRSEATGPAGTFTEESTLHTSDMLQFRHALAALVDGEEDAIKLDPMEPGLQVSVERGPDGFQFHGVTRASSEATAPASIQLEPAALADFAAQWSGLCDAFPERTPDPDAPASSDELPPQYAGPS